jgi:drug/metabolite transporter (DMT)-like permease
VIGAKSIVGLAGVVGFAIAANVTLKIGATAPAADRVFFGVFGWKTALGLGLFGCGGLLYAVLLRWVPLNLAQSFTAAQFVGVIAAASLMLSEPISPTRWVGIVFIGFGILLVGLTARA